MNKIHRWSEEEMLAHIMPSDLGVDKRSDVGAMGGYFAGRAATLYEDCEEIDKVQAYYRMAAHRMGQALRGGGDEFEYSSGVLYPLLALDFDYALLIAQSLDFSMLAHKGVRCEDTYYVAAAISYILQGDFEQAAMYAAQGLLAAKINEPKPYLLEDYLLLAAIEGIILGDEVLLNKSLEEYLSLYQASIAHEEEEYDRYIYSQPVVVLANLAIAHGLAVSVGDDHYCPEDLLLSAA